nr:MAG TPA: hypothetical protein [Caudoviricetes sp.]
MQSLLPKVVGRQALLFMDCVKGALVDCAHSGLLKKQT